MRCRIKVLPLFYAPAKGRRLSIPIDRLKLVRVLWMDSQGASPRWQYLDEAEPEALLCHTVGWLVREGKDAKRIAPHISEDHDGEVQIIGDMIIPNVSIVRMDVISSSCLDAGSTQNQQETEPLSS